MAYIIDKNKCTNCGTCQPLCPVEAITEVDDKRFIDPDTCISCGTCEGECPSAAIYE